ncbi:peptidoglycan-binding protein [Candidatus Peregrinibacteria bacterium]|nr:peptidoglycan-binding protein [Candidatus Peregrinibacteria bacterium]
MKVPSSTKLFLARIVAVASTVATLGFWPGIARAADVLYSPIPQTLSAGDVYVSAATATDAEPVRVSDGAYPYTQKFLISAYYSPLPNQNKYVTGSYAGDIRLNGDGVKAADGTVVYPGMVAAPKSYPFGSKMYIPGVGTVAVHDRGGAIVHAGERGNSYDRLDVWMGHGDAGLKRALTWGKRTVEVTMYGIDDSIVENVQLEGYDGNESIPNTLTPAVPGQSSVTTQPATPAPQPTQATIRGTFALGTTGEHVAKVQEILKDLNFYDGGITSTFDEKTQNAVKKFQVAEKIVTHENAYGAGYVGPRTLGILSSKAALPTAHAESVTVTHDYSIFERDLKLGDSGEDVRELQAELKNINLLGIDPTGFYGEVTAHAVFKFQQTQLLAGDLTSPGAGDFGPKTRAEMEKILQERKRTYDLIKAKEGDPS